MKRLIKAGFIALLRHGEADIIDALCDALLAGGVTALEIAFDPANPDTLHKTEQLIRMASGHREMLVGAGTVLTTEMADAAARAGAQFIVSPHTDKELIAHTKRLKLVSIAGAATPTEIMTAHLAGADIVKVFPVLPDRVDEFRILRGPLPHIPMMPTGGVNPETIPLFMEAGACAVSAGASVMPQELLDKRDFNAITTLATAHMKAILPFLKGEIGRQKS